MERLYYNNQYINEFLADILDISFVDDKYLVELDKTAFFPGGGGQFCDLGTIDNIEVIDVFEKDKKIFHVLNKKPSNLKNVNCKINQKRRLDGMHQHFAQHILSGCFYKLFGKNTTAFHLGKEFSTVDIEGELSLDEIKKVEEYANYIISQNIEVKTLIPDKNELKNIEIRRDLPDTDDDIRIIHIEGLDTNCCCGVHPKYTLEVKVIKIKRWEKHKNSTRVKFLAGDRAINYLFKRDYYLTDVCRVLKSTDKEATLYIDNLSNKLKDTKKQLLDLENKVVDFEFESLLKNSKSYHSDKIDNLNIIIKRYDENINYLNKLCSKVNDVENTVMFLAYNNQIFLSCSKNLDIDLKKLLPSNFKGGGSKFLLQGIVSSGLDDFFVNLDFNIRKEVL